LLQNYKLTFALANKTIILTKKDSDAEACRSLPTSHAE